MPLIGGDKSPEFISLMQAVNDNDWKQVDNLIASGIDINTRASNGYNTLLAVLSDSQYDNGNHFEKVKPLISRGANVNHQDKFGRTPLSFAITDGRPALAEFLRQAGAIFPENGLLNLLSSWPRYMTPNYRRCSDYLNVLDLLLAEDLPLDLKSKNGHTPLYIACYENITQAAEKLIDAGANVNLPKNDGRYPLSVAAGRKNIHIAQALLSAGADVNAINIDGSTALLGACSYEHSIDMVKLLLDAGADPNRFKAKCRTPLQEAAFYDLGDIISLLISHGTNINKMDYSGKTALAYAAEQGRKVAVSRLLEAEADTQIAEKNGFLPVDLARQNKHFSIVDKLEQFQNISNIKNVKGWSQLATTIIAHQSSDAIKLIANSNNLNEPEQDGRTVLHIAVHEGLIDVVDCLIKSGISVNGCNINNATPLHIAVEKDFTNITKILLDSGCDINQQNASGKTALSYAAKLLSSELITVLLECGAQVDIADNKEETPLFIACKNDHLENALLLIKAGANVNARDKFMRNPLHHIARSHQGFVDIAKLLINKGVDINATCDLLGEINSMCLAALTGNTEIVKLLVAAKADVNWSPNCGQTPLFDAAWKNFPEIVTVLLDAGAKINVNSSSSGTALHVACREGHFDIANQLILSGADVNLVNNEGDTPLKGAIVYNYADIVKLLFEHQADLNIKGGSRDWTPLHNAAWLGNTTMVELLIKTGADSTVTDKDGKTALELANDESELYQDYRADMRKKVVEVLKNNL